MSASMIRCGVLHLAIALTMIACRSESSSTRPTPPGSQSEILEASGVTGSTLRIGSEMLRDLRITTARVEEHQGGESSSLLGELGVNQNAYAEVSAPLPARVVSLRGVEGARVGT